MFNRVNTKKRYEKGKIWAFAGVATATLAWGVAWESTACAATTDAGPNQENVSGQIAKAATLSPTPVSEDGEQSAGDVVSTRASEDEKEDEGSHREKNAATGTSINLEDSPVAVANEPLPKMTSNRATKVTTAVTPDMSIRSPEQASTRRTARMTTSTSSTPQQPVSTPAVPVATPVTEETESIDQWMPDKNLQQVVLYRLKSDYNISSVNQITKKMLSTLVVFFSEPKYEQKNEAYHNAIIGIQSLKGLEYATNLEKFAVYPDVGASLDWNGSPVVYGKMHDISALANLKKLISVRVETSNVSDISALKNLKLKTVSLSRNHLYDISALQNSIDTLDTSTTMASQQINMPAVVLNSNTYTLPSFVINARGQNVPITPQNTAGNEGTKLDSQTVVWQLNASQGNLFMNWNDAYLGKGGYPFDGRIVVPYKIDNTVGNVNVTFKNKAGLTLAPQVTLAGPLGDSFDLSKSTDVVMSAQRIEQNGYSYIGTENNALITGSYTKNPTNVTLLFDVIDMKDVNTTFNFFDETGNKIAKSKTVKGKSGQGWQFTVPDLTGYTFTRAENDGENLPVIDRKLSGTFATDSVINLVYAVSDETATIRYVYADGSEAAPSRKVTGKYGSTIVFPKSPVISGYLASKLAPSNFSGGDEANTFTVTYTKDNTIAPPVTPTQSITVTVHYQTTDGTQVAPDVVITGKTGDAYTTSPAATVPESYELVATPANATGTMGDSDITVTYLYAKTETDGGSNQVAPEPDKPTTPSKPTKPTAKPGKVTSTTPDPGNQSDRVTGQQTPAKGGAAATVDLAAKPGAKVANQVDDNAKTTLPQTDEQSTSPLWGLALLGSLLGLVGLKKRKSEH
ncbi:MucBP domain-containing protein [Levilactobacillus angrenensis]|uniref:MucBP domain-containing protein n=1 Tax=Levilactobacillus angrenensis TaxID=2486020 RepID=A0ABW1UCD3_9LACO|nr:MucBP domain-containing protein [Levilactobacillus angrenensis]